MSLHHALNARMFLMVLSSAWATLRRVGEGKDALSWRAIRSRAHKARGLFIAPRYHAAVVGALAHPAVRPIVTVAPKLFFKYLTNYLKAGLGPRERASVLAHHYTFLSTRADPALFRAIADGQLELWRRERDGALYDIRLTFERRMHYEGDLTLVFCADAFVLFTLSFTIGQGTIAGLTSPSAIYVARVQGRAGELAAIRVASKRCLDVAPAALLLAAVEGIALALELEDVIGIGGQGQLSAERHSEPDGLVTRYDDFWIAAGGRALPGEMYHLEVPFREKPIEAIQPGHRARTRRKRAFKDAVRDAVRGAFGAHTLHAEVAGDV